MFLLLLACALEPADTCTPAVEVCNGLDDDCDGVRDEDAPTWFRDFDGDGFGDSESPHRTCSPPSDYVAVDGDCDDFDAAVYPGAEEVCDGRDQDCDGDFDEGLIETWYRDEDGDGWGYVVAVACEAPPEHVALGGDCDDDDPSVHPERAETCDGRDEDCDGEVDEDPIDAPTWIVDLDEDGWGGESVVACEAPGPEADRVGDCDDRDASVHPDAPEVCDGVDQDCDGSIDEEAVDAVLWYLDVDGDGIGDGEGQRSCEAPSGTTDQAGDCDDTDGEVFPGATETCDGRDEDCDGDTDEEAVDQQVVYADSDGDGYGDAGVTGMACSASTGWSLSDQDCDDTDDEVHPAATESCNGVDDDCDGDVDPDSSADASSWTPDGDGDGWGTGVAVTACEAPSGYGEDGDCDDGDSAVHPDADEDCDNGVDDDCDGDVDYGCGLTSTSLTVSRDDKAVIMGEVDAGDLDGDGQDDLVLAWAVGGGDGGVSVFFGPLTGDLALADADLVLSLDDFSDGTAVTLGMVEVHPVVADVDLDGQDDLLVGLSNYGFTSTVDPSDYSAWSAEWDKATGAVLIFEGPLSPGSGTDADADAVLTGEAGDHVGAGVAAGADLDGDGEGDVLVGRPDADASSLFPDVGGAWLLPGPISGEVDLSTEATGIDGSYGNGQAGLRVLVEDLDGDGQDDALLSMPGMTLGSTAAIFWGPITGPTDVASADLVGITSFLGYGFGIDLVSGDLDGDGDAELVFPQPYWMFTTTPGSVEVFDGPLSGSTFPSAAVSLTEEQADDVPGYHLALGDVDGDGAEDLLTVAMSHGDAGRVYLIPGSDLWTAADLKDGATVSYDCPADATGVAGLVAADLDGDGLADPAVSLLQGEPAVVVFTTAGP